jgi:hypothetical protein
LGSVVGQPLASSDLVSSAAPDQAITVEAPGRRWSRGRASVSVSPHLSLSTSADQHICVPHWRDRRCRSGVGGPGGEHAACGDDGEPEHATAGLALWRPAALADSAGHRVLLGLAVQVGDAGLHDLIVNGGVHHGLPVTQVGLLPPASPRRKAAVSHRADSAAVSLPTPGYPAARRSRDAKPEAPIGERSPSTSRQQVTEVICCRKQLKFVASCRFGPIVGSGCC